MRVSLKKLGTFGIIVSIVSGYLGITATPASAAGSISLTTYSAYTQNFNTLATNGTTNNVAIPGWDLTEAGGGARDNEQYAADDGASVTGDTYSYGAVGNLDRAFGGLQSGTLIPIFGASFTNNTGSEITAFDIGYVGEQWRIGTTVGRQDWLNFQYSSNASSLTTGTWMNDDSLDFRGPVTSSALPSALDGNLPGNRSAVIGRISGFSVPVGDTFWIRWTDENAVGADDGLAVDDFSITPIACPANIVVTNDNVNGPGSLHQAIGEVCAGGTITFDGDYSIQSVETINKNLTIDGSAHQITLDVGVMTIPTGVNVTLAGLTFSGRNQDTRAINNHGTLTLDRCTVSDYAFYSAPVTSGAAINNDGTLTINQSTLVNNISADSGGAIYNIGTLSIQKSLLAGNVAQQMGGAIFNYYGGHVTITSSTISGNQSTVNAGGIYNDQDMTISNSTIADNSTTNIHWLGGGILNNNGNIYLNNSIVANNFVSTTSTANDMVSLNLGYTYLDHSLVESGNVISPLTGDPLLSSLGNFGGGTTVYALLPGSPAIDAGNNSTCLSTDQRGVSVPQGSACDVGSFESQGFFLAKAGGDNQSTLTDTAFTNPLSVTVTANSLGEPVNGGRVTFTAPASGASANLTDNPAIIAGGEAGVTAAANSTDGAYSVTANTTGVWSNVAFSLTNLDASALSINDVTLNEGESGTTTFSFNVTLPAPAGPGGVVFDIATADNTATTGNLDYEAKSLTGQMIPQGSSTYAFDVTINGDNTTEPNETFHVNISNVVGATISDAQGSGTIANDDFTSVVSTGIATGITGSSATLNGSVNASGFSSTVTFEYGLTNAYGSTVTAIESPVTGNLDTPVSAIITGLLPNSTYHFRVVSVNSHGTTYGDDNTFHTLTTTITTTVHDASHTVITSAPVGNLLHAAAVISGSGSAPTGSVTFNAYNNPSCSGIGITAGTVNLDGTGVSDPSLSSILTDEGLSFRAHYNGDSNYPATDGTCTAISSNSFPTVLSLSSNTNPQDGAQLSSSLRNLYVQFNMDVLHGNSANPNSANNPVNYLLVESGDNSLFDTTACGPAQVGGLRPDDILININSVIYDSDTFVARLAVNNGTALPAGTYRLFVCGTTSITDPTGTIFMNNHTADSQITFEVARQGGDPAARTKLPATGFTPNLVTLLPYQPAAKAYDNEGIRIEIPTIDVDRPIVGVPGPDWNVTWLGSSIGYLEGTAFPTWNGSSALTGHVTDANGNPGPFADLGSLKWGDTVIIHAWGQDYYYEVRTVDRQASPDSTALLMKHEESPWLTLITCSGYDEESDSYRWRTVVRAVLVDFE